MTTQAQMKDKVAKWLEDVDRQLLFINGEPNDVVVLRDGRVLKTMSGLENDAKIVIDRAQDIAHNVYEQVDRAATLADLAGQEADRAEAAAQGALAAVADGVYPTPEDGLADHAADGTEAYFAIGSDNSLGLFVNQGGVALPKVNIATHQSLRETGINLWQIVGPKLCLAADPSDLESDWEHITNEINDAIDVASAWGIGVIHCGGAARQYICGGDQITYGVQAIQPIGHDQPYDMPFKRGRIVAKSNVELRGNSPASRAKFLAAPELDPGPLFTDRWFDDPDAPVSIHDFALRNLDLDGNEENYTVSAYDLGVNDGPMWIQGHCMAWGKVVDLLVEGCRIHGWWGHGLFGGSRNFLIRDNHFYNNMQGGFQTNGNGLRSIRNRFYGDGGWTAVGENLETGGEDQPILDTWIVDCIYDMREGFSTTIATARQFATNSPEALAARRHFRRAIFLSGNYYGAPTEFARQRGRIHIINPKIWQGNIGGGGFDRIIIQGAQIENTYEADVTQWPLSPHAMDWGPTAEPPETLGELTIRDAMIIHQQDEGYGIKARQFQSVQISGDFKGMKTSPVRLDNCGGKVDIIARNYGFANDTIEFWKSLGQSDEEAAASLGSASAGVTVYGHLGPIEINVHAVDDRPDGQRNAKLIAYINNGYTYVNKVSGLATGLSGVNDELISAPYALVIDAGTYSPDHLVSKAKSLVVENDLEVGGDITTVGETISGALTVPTINLNNADGDAYINVRPKADSQGGLNFFNDGNFTASIRKTADDQVSLQKFVAGAPVGLISLTSDGHIFLSSTWQRPIQMDGENYYWTSADNKLRYKSGRPAGDMDGVVVGTQAGA